jgi:1-deoxy-D-xylulose-5-phosphate synthase
MSKSKYKLLDKINFPSDYKNFTGEELIQLCNDLREYIIEVVSVTPGHFAASLGVVELTVALHYVFNTPYDKLIWDVGHQAYGHKILTGRKENFHTLRQLHGVSGFPNIFESEYDAFTVGHSSTSISAALGIAIAARQKNENRKAVAIIGDGSMTAGLAFEGMNNAGMTNSDLLIILNDNNMAIDANVGALNEYLLDITTSKTYNRVKDDIWNVLGKMKKIGPNTQGFIQKIENGIKSVILKQSNLFEALNLRYFGPVDGHDVVHLTEILKDLKDIPGPKLLHCITKKGKGYKYAEENQTKWHATSCAFDIKSGKIINPKCGCKSGPRFQDVFGLTLVELAEKNEKIIGITPAMPSGSSLNIMMEKIPERAFDVGIAEQHAVTFSAGLAANGLIPFCNIYSSFMQRAYDQVIHDVALQNLHVVFCLDRGGLVGADGATHHGAYDLSFMRNIPNLVIASPLDEIELRNMMFTAQIEKNKFPFVIRYPRGSGENPNWQQNFEEIEIGKGRNIRQGEDLAILSIGPIGTEAINALNVLDDHGFSIAHYDMRFVKPLDVKLLHEIFNKFTRIITLEDNSIIGGFGSAVIEFMSENNYHAIIKRLGIPDSFIEHGTQEELYKICGYDSDAIIKTVKDLIFVNQKVETPKI